MLVTIVSPSAEAVKPRRHTRIIRADLPASEINPALKAFGTTYRQTYPQGARGAYSRDDKYRLRAGTSHS